MSPPTAAPPCRPKHSAVQRETLVVRCARFDEGSVVPNVTLTGDDDRFFTPTPSLSTLAYSDDKRQRNKQG